MLKNRCMVWECEGGFVDMYSWCRCPKKMFGGFPIHDTTDL